MQLQKTSILNSSGWQTAWHKHIPIFKNRNDHVVKGVSSLKMIKECLAIRFKLLTLHQ